AGSARSPAVSARPPGPPFLPFFLQRSRPVIIISLYRRPFRTRSVDIASSGPAHHRGRWATIHPSLRGANMTVLVTCPACEARLRIPEDRAGKKIRCPKGEAAIDAEAGEEVANGSAGENKGTGSDSSSRISSRPPARSRPTRDRDDDEDDDRDARDE